MFFHKLPCARNISPRKINILMFDEIAENSNTLYWPYQKVHKLWQKITADLLGNCFPSVLRRTIENTIQFFEYYGRPVENQAWHFRLRLYAHNKSTDLPLAWMMTFFETSWQVTKFFSCFDSRNLHLSLFEWRFASIVSLDRQ